MTKTRFVDCFWGNEFNSTLGFDVLCKRMRDGKQVCTDFEEFVKQRAEAEERYGRSLIRLAKVGENGPEIGTLKQSWDVLRQETEHIGHAHLQLSQQLTEQLGKLHEFKESQRTKRKEIEDKIKKCQKDKKNCYDRNLTAKRNYENKCKEHDTSEDNHKKLVSAQSNNEEKARIKLSKAKTAMENADTNYQTTIKQLEEARREWEREMEICCNVFQELEEERISFLRESMWTYTNLGSGNCVKTDDIYEDIRKSLECCDIDSDIYFLSVPNKLEVKGLLKFFMKTSTLHKTIKNSPAHSPTT